MTILLCVADEPYVEKYFPCIYSHRRYCNKMSDKKKNNYKYHLVTGSREERNWKRYKINELHRLLHTTNDDVVLIDGDCYIKEHTPNFKKFLQPDKSIYYVNGRSGRLNSGFLYFKNNQNSKDFVTDLLEKLKIQIPRGNGYFVTPEGENGHVIWLKEEYENAGKRIFCELPKHYNCSSKALKDQAYILHFTNELRRGIHGYRKMYEDKKNI